MYLEDYKNLENRLPKEGEQPVYYEGMKITRHLFQSPRAELLPDLPSDPLEALPDKDIFENQCFPFFVFHPADKTRHDGAIILLHGLNEKSWNKYLPWAAELSRNTGKKILLFPLSFHMDRAPAGWSSPRTMLILSKLRKERFGAGESSFINAALSSRLHAAPQRFFSSGLEAFADVTALLRMIRRGGVDGVGTEGRIDFFGYSIGAFLTQILMLANPEGLLSDSRAVLFCGGATLDRMNPVSKYILDSAAAAALRTHLARKGDPLNEQPFGDVRIGESYEPAARVFQSMAQDAPGREDREKLLQKVTGRLFAILLKQDRVMPAEAVKKTLVCRNNPLKKFLRVLDFPFPHDHVTPFPQLTVGQDKVDRAFKHVFTLAAEGLGG
ncbi:MAG: hypothetical protein JW760_04020 [Spirochaetales bacterium]|nr:hypothetical protein [Spirochaetales bacterium]